MYSKYWEHIFLTCKIIWAPLLIYCNKIPTKSKKLSFSSLSKCLTEHGTLSSHPNSAICHNFHDFQTDSDTGEPKQSCCKKNLLQKQRANSKPNLDKSVETCS